jgi:hypothetical protein
VDRHQKIARVANRSGRVFKVSNLEVNSNYIHSDYECEPCGGILTDTGDLRVLKLVPKSGSGPYFTARWDQKPEHLDIDMHGASKSAIGDFKNNRNGYSGHHTSRSTDPDKRIFDVKIETPAGVIFDGSVSFSNNYELIVATNLCVAGTLDGELIRGDGGERD